MRRLTIICYALTVLALGVAAYLLYDWVTPNRTSMTNCVYVDSSESFERYDCDQGMQLRRIK